MQGPEIWLTQLGIELNCAVDPAQPAILDADHRIFVNYETYYVSSLAARDEFRHEPWRYAGIVTDPISRERFQPTEASPRTQCAGREFIFTSQRNAARFQAAPDQYATPVVPYAGHMAQ